jgi:mannose-1-phosphate guanylyltransferase/phosphomannomutase
VSQVFDALPPFTYWRDEIPCPVDKKGLAMRRMSEDSVDKEATFVDGVQVFLDATSVLLLPDPYKPALHLVVEGPEKAGVQELASKYQAKVRAWVAE